MTINVTETGPFERLVRFQLTDEQIKRAQPVKGDLLKTGGQKWN